MNKLTIVLFLTITLVACKQQKTDIKTIKEPVQNSYITEISNGKVFTTESKSAIKLQLTQEEVLFSNFTQPLETEASILVNPSKQYQTFMGIGAALTDAAAETFYKLDEDQQKLFMEAYFSLDKGIGYSLARTIIHSCDFSNGSYTYVEDGD